MTTPSRPAIRVQRAQSPERQEYFFDDTDASPLREVGAKVNGRSAAGVLNSPFTKPDTFLAKAAAPNAALARTDSDALWQRNGGEVSTSGAAGRVSLYAQDGSGRSAALRSLIASSEQGNAAAIRELLESFPQPKSLASAIRGRPGAPDHGHGGGWRKAVHWAFDRTSQSASTTIPPGSSSSPADEAIASLIAFGAALELSVNDEGSAEFWERGTDGYAEANAGRVTDWLTDTSREDRMRRLFLCTAAASLAAERTELLRETTAQAKRIRQLEAQLELKRREAERLKEELGATQQREREAVAAAAQLEQPGAGAEELLRKMILAAGVTVAKENADGLRLTRIVRWVADSNRLEWSDKVSGPWQRASTDGARATLRREQLTIFIVYPEERTVVCHCITHEQICWAKMLVEHLEAQKRAAQIAAAAAAEEAALAGLAAAGGAATLGRSSR